MEMQPRISSQVLGFLRRRFWLVILIAAHVPFVIAYLSGLWQQTHYQFFPFAIGAFAWLFATRRSDEPERWKWPTWILIGVDLACLAAQGWQYSPWLAAVGLVACVTAWCYANRDAGYNRRLTYLALLPLLVIRLPLQYDQQVIHWLQRVTTSVASRTMHRFGMLHYRDGNVLQFPGKSFMVEEACSGVQSLFTILFIAALVICLKRRSAIHGAVMLASGLVFAGIMNTLRVISVAVAWDVYAIDISGGISHDVLGYICLGVAALLLMSADSFLGFITDPVPDLFRPGAVGLFFNPLIRLWNRLMAVVPTSKNYTPSVSSQDSAKSDGGVSDAKRRKNPRGIELLKPGNWFHFALGWLECWYFSRKYGHLLAGLPFVAVTVGGIYLVGWMIHSSEMPIIAAYEKAFNAAAGDNQEAKQETYLRALSSLRPLDPQYRFRLGEFMVQQGRKNEGLNEILRLAPGTTLGYADARMWLVRQALQPEPLKPMSAEEIEKQLKAVVERIPRHVEAHQMLAQLYTERKEWRLAEQHLSKAASIKPELNLALAGLKKRRNASSEDIRGTAQRAVVTLSEQLEKNRADSKVRVALVEAMVIAGDERTGREVLISGLQQQKDDPVLLQALSQFDVMMVDRRLTESALNRDACVPVVAAALERDPSNVMAIQMLLRLQTMGAQISGVSFQRAVDYWQKAIDENPDDNARILLSQILLLSGNPEKAAETVQPALEQRPELRLTFAQLLKQSGKTTDSTALMEDLIAKSQSRLEQDPQDTTAAAQLAEALLASGHPEDARQCLSTFAEDPAISRIPADPALASLYGRACLGAYDQLTRSVEELRRPINGVSIPVLESRADTAVAGDEAAGTPEPAVLLELLADAFACRVTTNSAIDRISRLSLSSHPAASGAEEFVRQLRLEGTYGAQVLNLLGMHALLMNRYDKARSYLEQANTQTRGRDPMVLNNLATAIIRGSDGSKDRALQLANETLALLPDHPDALSTRGEVYVAMKRWPEAVADLTESLKLRQKNAELHRLLEKAYTGLPDLQMAEEHRQRAEELEAAAVTAVKSHG